MLAGLIKFLFWFFLISYLFKMIGRFLLPYVLKKYIRKQQSKFNHGFGYRKDNVEKEGKVTIKKNPKKPKSDTSDMGEYVDFEEIDEKK